MEILTFSSKNSVEKICDALAKKGIVILPSDTVYGLCVDATNDEAVQKLIEFKRRPLGKAISVFVQNIKDAEKYVDSYNHQLQLNELLPGPFTIVLPSKHILSKKLESERGTLGIRIPQYDFIQQVVEKYGKPITATSANISGMGPHYSVESLLKTLSQKKKEMIDLIIDAGKLPHNKPSTVVDLSGEELKIIRHGDVNIVSSGTYISHTPQETQKIADFLFEKYTKAIHKKSVVFLLQGELGTGKTIFVKEIGKKLQINDIVSPTYVIYYEYETQSKLVKKLIHFDLYNIETEEELKGLKIDELLLPENVLCIEWGEKSGAIIEMLKQKATVILIELLYITEKERKIEIHEYI